MINGWAKFKRVGNSWRVIKFINFGSHLWADTTVYSYPTIKVLIFAGRFNRKLRAGRFCGKPHHYLILEE